MGVKKGGEPWGNRFNIYNGLYFVLGHVIVEYNFYKTRKVF